MAVIIVRRRAKTAGSAGLASLGAKVPGAVRRAGIFGAAAVMVGAVGAALVQLVAELLSFPAPIAVIGITVLTVALLCSLHRHLRTGAGRR